MGKALRIGLVTETFLPEINGVAMTLSRLLEQLLQQGHKVQLVRPQQRDEEGVPSFDVETLLVQGASIPGYSELRFGLPSHRQLKRAWQQQRPDVIYIATEGPLGWSAVNVADKMGIPAVSGFHTQFHQYSQYYKVGWLKPLVYSYLKAMHNRTACTLVPTEMMRNEMSCDIDNLAVLGRGIDTALFQPNKRCESLRCEWGVGPKDKVYLYVGRLAREKNVSLALESFKQIKVISPSAKLVLVGEGPDYQRLYAHHDGVIFVGSKVGDELAAHYASADIFLFPSSSETFGNVVLEAMSSGLGVVAFDSAAAGIHIKHGESGLLSDVGDEEGFIRNALMVNTNRSLLHAIRQRARRVMEGNSWQQVGREFEGVLRRCANREAYDDSDEHVAANFSR